MVFLAAACQLFRFFIVRQSTEYHKLNCGIVMSVRIHAGMGPAVEWWAAKQDDKPLDFPYPANAQKIAKLGEVGAYPNGTIPVCDQPQPHYMCLNSKFSLLCSSTHNCLNQQWLHPEINSCELLGHIALVR